VSLLKVVSDMWLSLSGRDGVIVAEKDVTGFAEHFSLVRVSGLVMQLVQVAIVILGAVEAPEQLFAFVLDNLCSSGGHVDLLFQMSRQLLQLISDLSFSMGSSEITQPLIFLKAEHPLLFHFEPE